MAKRRSTRRKSSPRRRRRSYRRNPGGIGKKPVKALTEGVKNAAFVLAGKAAVRAVPTAMGLQTSGAIGIATQAAIGLGAAMVAEKVLPRGAGPFVLAGALSAPLESIVVAANVPFVSSALSAYPTVLSAYPGVGELPASIDTSPASLGSYVMADY